MIRSAHGSDAVFHDRESQADAGDVLNVHTVGMCPREALKNRGDRVLWNAETVVANLKTTRVRRIQRSADLHHSDRLARVRILDGVGQQVHENQFQAPHVYRERRQVLGDLNLNTTCVRHFTKLAGRLLIIVVADTSWTMGLSAFVCIRATASSLLRQNPRGDRRSARLLPTFGLIVPDRCSVVSAWCLRLSFI